MQFLYFDSHLFLLFCFYLRRQNNPYKTCSGLLCVNIEIKPRRILLLIAILTNWMLFSCSQEMSWFVKNAFNNVYPCVSKIWTVSKLHLLITWLANTNSVDQSPLQRAVLYTHLQIVNYRWFKMFWFETNEEKNKLR